MQIYNRDKANERQWFDDAPAKPFKVSNAINTSSINTTAYDPYRQGVEITNVKYFDIGSLKIHAGEDGHVVKQRAFGQGRNFCFTTPFTDAFDPANNAMTVGTATTSVSLQFGVASPIDDYDDIRINGNAYNGSIDVFGVRLRADAYNIYVPIDHRGVKGIVCSGNESDYGSDPITSIDYVAVNTHHVPFIDANNKIEPRYLQLSTRRKNSRKITPFIDVRFELEYKNNSEAYQNMSSMSNAIFAMSASYDAGYVSSNKIAYSSGWTYENSERGVDSIVFGGRTY